MRKIEKIWKCVVLLFAISFLFCVRVHADENTQYIEKIWTDDKEAQRIDNSDIFKIAEKDGMFGGINISSFSVKLSSETAEIVKVEDGSMFSEFFPKAGYGAYEIEKKEDGSFKISQNKTTTTSFSAGNINELDAKVYWLTVKDGEQLYTGCLIEDSPDRDNKTNTPITGINTVELYDSESGTVLYDSKGNSYTIDAAKGGISHVRMVDDAQNNSGLVKVRINGEMNKVSETRNGLQGWLSADENYVSVNGQTPVRINNSNETEGNHDSQTLCLKKGINVIQVMSAQRWSFINDGTTDAKKDASNLFDRKVGSPKETIDVPEGLYTAQKYVGRTTLGSSKKYRTYTNVFVVNYNGEQKNENLSNDTSIDYLEAVGCIWGKKKKADLFTAKLNSGNENDPSRIASSAETTGNTKVILGIVTTDPLATWDLSEEYKDRQRGNRIGKYMAVDVAGLDKISVDVKAADGTVGKHYIEFSRASSACDLQGIDVENGSLTTKIEDGEQTYHINSNGNGKVKTVIHASDGATVKINGELTDTWETEDLADLLEIEITAADKVTKKNYYIIFELNGENQFFKTSGKTADTAKALLSGWESRSDAEKKDLLTESYWGVFKAVATNVSLNNAVVKDMNDIPLTQTTGWAAAIMQMVKCGDNPYNYDGVNFVENMMKAYDASKGGFTDGWGGNSDIWGLMGLRAAGADVPQALIENVKKKAMSRTYNEDMRGWAMAAAAPYMTETEKIENLISLKDLQIRSTADLKGKAKEVENIGLFYASSMGSANSYSNGCLFTGIAATGVDIDHFFAVNTEVDGKEYMTSPLKAVGNLKAANGEFYDNYYYKNDPTMSKFTGYTKDLIIGLGDIYYGGCSWDTYYLNMTTYKELLSVANSYKGTSDDAESNKKLETAISEASNALNKNANSIEGLGEYYYNLYEALASVNEDAVNKPKNLRTLRKLEDNDAINAVDEKITVIENTENVFDNAETVIKVKKAYDALGEGQDEAYQERMRGYVTKADVLQDAYEKLQTVLPVIEAIDNLPETATTEAEAAIEAARVAYKALSDAEKTGVYNYSKLADLLAQLEQLKDKATAVSEQIDALPAAGQVTLENEAAIAAARAAYDALSDAEKAAVTNYDKLQAAEQQIGNIKAAAEVTQMIDAIGEITLDNYETKYEQIVTARSAYDTLTESAKALVTNLDTLKKAEETYQSMDEDVREVIEAINQLKDPLSKSSADMDANALYEIWNKYTYVVVNIRGLADELTKDKQAIVTNMKDLETAEAYIQKIKDYDQKLAEQDTAAKIATGNYAQAEKLLSAEGFPKFADYDPTNADKKDITKVADQVAQAKAVVDKLTDEQKAALDEKLGAGTIKNLNDLADLANAVEGYDDQYKTTQDELDKAAEKIRDEAAASQYVSELTEVYNTYKDKEVSRSDIAIIRQTIKAYDDLTDAQKDIIKNAENASTITAMLDALKKQDEQVQKDEKVAAEVTEYIKNLPTSLNLDNMEAVRSDLQMIADKYNALNANAKSYVRMLSKVTATNNVLNTMTAEINTFRQGKPAVTAAATAYNSVTVSWNTYQYAQSYDVYRKTAGGEWTKLGNTTALQYVDQTAAGSTAYSYTVVALSSRWGQSVSSAYDENGAAVTTPAAPQPDNGNTTPDNSNTTPDNNNTPAVKDYTSLKATAAGVSSIKLSWKKVSKASGYVVYRANSANGKYKAIKTIKKGKTTSFTDKKRTTGKTYYYKLRPYKTVKNKKQYMDYSSVVSTKAVPGRVKFTKLTAGNQKATLKWKKVSGASGYLLYRSDRRDGGFTCINSVSRRKTSYTNTKLKKGQIYYYRIRAYRKVGGKRVYGNFSVVKAVKAK